MPTAALLWTIAFTPQIHAAPSTIAAVVVTTPGEHTYASSYPTISVDMHIQLTVAGQNGLSEAGRFVRSRWLELAPIGTGTEGLRMQGFDGSYEPGNVYARTTDTPSQLLSSYPFLSALFMPATNTSTPHYIPVRTVPEDDDVSLLGSPQCTKLDSNLNTVMHSPSMKTRFSENAALVKEVETRLGRMVAAGEWVDVYTYLRSQKSQNASFVDLSSAQWTNFTQLVTYIATENFKSSYGVGNFIGEVIQSLDAGVNSERKITYLSAEATTFLSFFAATGIQADVPSPASLLLFEIVSDSGVHNVRVSYRNGQSSIITLPLSQSATETFPFTTFKQLLNQRASTSFEGWCRSCGNTVSRGCEAIARSGDGDAGSRSGLSRAKVGIISVICIVAGVLLGVIGTILWVRRNMWIGKWGVEVVECHGTGVKIGPMVGNRMHGDRAANP